MKILVLGKGVANDGVVLLLEEEKLEYDYLNLDELKHFEYSLVVKSPGIPYYDLRIKKFLKLGIKVITDIELAYTLRKKFYIGITGSNGKTTTSSMIAHILSSTYDVVLCGNIGYSVCRALVEHPTADIFVVELSSFQLEQSRIDLNISVFLNVHPCHLDHHIDYKDYIDSKANICLNQSPNHYFIYSYDDPILRQIAAKTPSTKISFSNRSYLADCYIHDEKVYIKRKKMLKLTLQQAKKGFLLEDLLASIAVVNCIKGITPHIIQKQMKSFKEIEYRLTKINSYIYNDAKSTNPYSTIAALSCFKEPVELICGGYDRKENLSCLSDSLKQIKRVYAYGQTREKIKLFMQSHQVECFIFDSLDEALKQAIADRDQEPILYSPMFASFDGFKNYVERGKYFTEITQKYL